MPCTVQCTDNWREDDIQDHSHIHLDNVQERFDAYRDEVKNAVARKGQPLPTATQRNIRIDQFLDYKIDDDPAMDYESGDSREIPGDCLPRAYPPSVAPVGQLTKIMIRALKLERHHRRHYVLLKTITKMYNRYWAMVIVEDEEGGTLLLQLHNQGPHLANDLGTVFLVKEPYVTKLADGTFGIRVDHPADVKAIPQFDISTPAFVFGGIQEGQGNQDVPVDPSPDFWKKKGNGLYKENKFGLAIVCYTKALGSANPRIVRGATGNRTLAYLKTDQFDAALLDTESILREDEPGQLRDKTAELALFRKAKALSQLGRLRDCCNTYEALLRRNPNYPKARTNLGVVKEQISHEDNADYSFRTMMEKVTLKSRDVQCGTYVGPVKVRETENHGKGLFTTKAVKAGDLLLCEKAFALATSTRNWRCKIFYPDTDEDNMKYLFNTETGKVVQGTQADLVENITQKVFRNPSLLPRIMELDHGSYESAEVQNVDGVPVVDSFLIDRIVELNCFGAPPITQRHQRNEPLGGPIRLNRAFSTGLWVTASRLNHSCVRNAFHSIIGDMFILRAAQDIPADTEITIWLQLVKINAHVNSQAPFKLKHYNFTCDCILCSTRQSCGKNKFSTRGTVLTNFLELAHESSPHSKDITDRMDRAIVRLENTYAQPASEVPRLELWSAYCFVIANALKYGFGMGRLAVEDIEKAANNGIKALESLSFVVEGGTFPRQPGDPLTIKKWGLMRDEVVALWINLCAAYSKVAPDMVDQALAYAKLTYKICYGEDDTFEHEWHNPLQTMRANLTTLMW